MAPFVRILLRYIAAALVTKGVIDAETASQLVADADAYNAIEIALGLALGALNEAWYVLARRNGWAK